MKRLILVSACALLTACGGTHGLRGDLPDLSSHTDKSVTDYVECVRAKWAALSNDASVQSKDAEAHLSATDKNGARELLDVTANGKGAQAIMYERQSSKKTYDPQYRDAATSCL